MNKNLVAYAYLAQAKRSDGDLVSGLMPIFKPIARELSGQAFNAKAFAEKAESTFGLKVNPLAAEDLAPRLEAAGILEKEIISGNEFKYIYSEINEDFTEVREEQITSLLNSFIEFLKENSKTIIKNEEDEDRAKNTFLEYITNLDFAKIYIGNGNARKKQEESQPKKTETLSLPKLNQENEEEKESETNHEDENHQTQKNLITAISSYIYETKYKDRENYDLIIKICAGSLVSEVVLNFQNPETNIKLVGTYFVLDTPFLMALLDLDSPESTEPAKLIINTLKENGARIAVYSHSIDELKDNLKAVQENYNQGTAYRATAKRLHKQSFREWFDVIKNKPDIVLSESKIEILKSNRLGNFSSSYSYFSKTNEENLYGALTHIENPTARDRDVKSIAETIRRRQGQTAENNDLQKVKYAFISGNSKFVRTSREFCITEGIYSENEFPPAVTDKYLAGLLWVIYGGSAVELPRLSLLANCASTLEPNNETVIKMLDLLQGIDEGQAKIFQALMTDERASHYLTKVSIDGPQSVNEHNIGEILENMKGELAHEHEQKVRRIEEEFENQKTSLENENAKTIAELRKSTEEQLNSLRMQRQREALRNSEKTKQLDAAMEQIKLLEQREEERIRKEQEKRLRIASALMTNAHQKFKTEKRISYTICGLLILASPFVAEIFGELNSVVKYSSIVLGAVVSFLGFADNKVHFIDKPLSRRRLKRFEELLQEKDICLEELNRKPNWNTLVLEKKQ